MILVISLVILWFAIGIIGGSLVYLTKFDMTMQDIFLNILFGTILGPFYPLVSGLTLLVLNAPKGIVINRFRSSLHPVKLNKEN